MPQDLRSYLEALRGEHPEQLKVVTKEVDPEFEVAAIMDRSEYDARYPGFPAVLFTNVRGSDLPPLLINLHGTYVRLAFGIGTDIHEMVPEYARRDCTKPAPAVEFPPGCRVPPDVVERVDPEELIVDYEPGTIPGLD